MAKSDAAYLESLKIARDAIVDGIVAGRLTITYRIRNREHTVVDPISALERIDKLIAKFEKSTVSTFRLAKINRARGV